MLIPLMRQGLLSLLLLQSNLWAATDDSQKLKRIHKMVSAIDKRWNVGSITATESLSLWRRDPGSVQFIDTREEHERQVSSLPGAISVKQFEIDPQKYAGKTLIAYCTIGYRSSRYIHELGSSGLKVLNLKGSVLLWLHAGGKLEDGQGRPTKKVHVYGEAWDLAPLGYETITE